MVENIVNLDANWILIRKRLLCRIHVQSCSERGGFGNGKIFCDVELFGWLHRFQMVLQALSVSENGPVFILPVLIVAREKLCSLENRGKLEIFLLLLANYNQN